MKAQLTDEDHDHRWMDEALAEARAAAAHDDVPVGAVVVASDGKVGRGHNRREIDRDPTAHAELLALRDLARQAGAWNLDGSTLYVTHEPCAMCAGAIINARVRRVVFGCDNPKAGAVRSLYRLVEDTRLNHRAEVTPNVRAAECAALLTEFFQRLRARQ